MKIKSLIAALAASAIAVGAMAVTAGAQVTNGNATGSDGSLFWSYDLSENNYEIAAVYGFELSITPADAELPDGMGGGIGVNSDSTGWKSVEWGNPGADKPVTVDVDNWTITYTGDGALFAESDEWGQLWLQNWWGSELSVDSVKILGADGNELAPGEDGGDEDTDPDTTTTTEGEGGDTTTTTTAAAAPNASTTKPATTTKAGATKTGDAGVGVAIASLTLAGAAAYIARKKG